MGKSSGTGRAGVRVWGKRGAGGGIPVGAKEESWVSAEEILKSLLRDSESTKRSSKTFFVSTS